MINIIVIIHYDVHQCIIININLLVYHHPDHHHPGHCPGGGNQLCERARTRPKRKLFALLRDRDGQGVQVSDGGDGDEFADDNYGV